MTLLRPISRLSIIAIALLLGFAPAIAQETPQINARQALLVDVTNGRELLAHNADEAMAPSSMAKLMVQYIVFEALRDGRVTIFTPVRVSRRAAQQRGSGIDLRAGETLSFGVLLHASIVYSANDATVAIAEHMARSEADFARAMTERAEALGLQSSIFANATGFTHQRQQMTARDLVRLSTLIIDEFPDWYRLYASPDFRFRGETYRNRNPILGTVEGADGIKTGQTRAGGFGLTASAVRDGRRLILVINGMESAEARAEEARRLLEWGFQQPAQQSE